MAKKKARSLFATGMSRAIKLIVQFVVVVSFWIAFAVVVADHLSKFRH